ncbi:MAG: hypothetical protein DMF69_18010 [Acidobacteria bacterium]|nr:MAG: hypothetical protein DMF69_18010 [Acidobacteriota bacterium]
MHNSSPSFAVRGFIRVFLLTLVISVSGSFSSILAANPKAPTLVSHTQDAVTNPTGTRAVAFESVSMKAEPFPLSSTVQYSPDTRTRICVFAMSLDLLQGEGVNAFSADMQDSAGKLYATRVEFMGQVPNFPGITMFILRLPDDIGDVGDVLLRLNLHGMGSNRVRVAIGHAGGGPTDDPGAVATPAPAIPPAADQPFVPDSYAGPVSSDADAVRFLEQTTWGPTSADIAHVKAVGFRAYLNEQFSAAVANPAKGSNYPDLFFPNDDPATACPTSSPGDPNYNQAVCNRDNFSMYPAQRTFFSNAFYGQDQLRQRVAFALHQILVVSGSGEVNRPSWLTIYLQALDRNALGNYRTLLQEITLTPAMGEYLDMRLSTRTNPNENWAREVLQLFSIGTDVLNLDGTAQRDAQGNPIPSYSQTDVNEFTRVFTGWNIVPGTIAPGTSNWRDPMIPRGGTNHDFGAKTLLNGFTTTACSSASGAANIACAQSDLTAALNNISNHPNVGPFLSKQLIQHLVTSNPSPAYVERVARVFNNDCDALYPQGCTSARGNLRSVVQAILLDPEARGDVKTDPNYGKLREPAQYIAGFLRAFKVKGAGANPTSDGVLGGRSSTDFTGTLDQPIFQPTTVFSYYQPGYEVPGAKILGPAFGILSTSTTLRRANDINTLVYSGVSVNTTPTPANPDRPLGTSIDIANLEALAANPGDFQITSALNTLLFHGTMSTQVRDAIVGAMNGITTATEPNATLRNQKRARVAVYLAATSSQYDIQR